MEAPKDDIRESDFRILDKQKWIVLDLVENKGATNRKESNPLM